MINRTLDSKALRDKKKIYILGVIAAVFILVFVFQGLNEKNLSFNLSKRIPKVIAITLTGGSIAFSSLIFQTVTNNKILTPSILGLDSLYMFVQTISIFTFGATSIFMTNKNVNFLLSVCIMLVGSLLLYKMMFNKESNGNLFFLLLVGTIFGTLFKSMTSFMQVLIDPNEFEVLQSKMFASFSNVNTEILFLAVVLILIVIVMIYDDFKKLDVMLLGRDQAINLGIDYDRFSKKILIVVSILVSISTALVGQITFLGLLVVNLSYQFFKGYEHKYHIIGSILISIIALIGGQFVVERILNFNSTVSIIINFVGGIYFIYLLLKEGK